MTISVKTYIKGEFLSAADLNATLTTLVDEINRLAALPADGQKNYLINGDFSVWQRGTSQAGNNIGSDDRWKNDHAGSTKLHSQQAFTAGQTDVPNNPKYFSRTVVTSVAGAGNHTEKEQTIEDVTKLSGETMTLSFWAKADSAKNIAVEFLQYFGTGGSPSANVEGIGVTTVNLTTEWAKHTVTVEIPSVSGKTIGTNNDHYTRLTIWFEAGSSLDSRTNSLGQQSGTFDIANIQLEKGDTATDFEYIDEATQLARCKRYFQKGYSIDVDPGTSSVSIGMAVGRKYTSANNSFNYNAILQTGLRSDSPTVNLYSPATGTANTATRSSNSTDAASEQTMTSIVKQVSNTSINIFFNTASAFTSNADAAFHWTVDAEL